jgi:hypothetical protein
MKTPEQPRIRSGFAFCSSDLDTSPSGRRGPDQTPTGSATPKECVSMIEALERACQQEGSPGTFRAACILPTLEQHDMQATCTM